MSVNSRNQNLVEKEESFIKELFMMAIGYRVNDKAKENSTLCNLTIVSKGSIQMVWKMSLESIPEKSIIKYLYIKVLSKMASFTALVKSK